MTISHESMNETLFWRVEVIGLVFRSFSMHSLRRCNLFVKWKKSAALFFYVTKHISVTYLVSVWSVAPPGYEQYFFLVGVDGCRSGRAHAIKCWGEGGQLAQRAFPTIVTFVPLISINKWQGSYVKLFWLMPSPFIQGWDWSRGWGWGCGLWKR